MEVKNTAGQGALITEVLEDSPAYDAGFEPGCRILAVDGQPLRDLIDWRWLSAEDEVTLAYVDLDGEEGEVELWREEGEDWGLVFDGVVFDGIKLCRNACIFCFMRQLPDGMRDSLSLRDDDYRLSFLSGTFVTLTNCTPEDEARIIQQHLSPLRISIHVTNPEVRRHMMGKHAMHGLEVLDRLLDAGIQAHCQIVLMPGINDGAYLQESLDYLYARPGVSGVGIVPLGYTKHQTKLQSSFNSRESSRGVIDVIKPFQRRALDQRGNPWVFAADEFYSNAFPDSLLDNVPPTSWYGDFDMFEDGIGIIRSFIDDWLEARASGALDRAAQALQAAGKKAVLISGCAQREFLTPLLASSPVADFAQPLYVTNDFFGGNVDVTGLLVGEDIARAVAECASQPDGDSLMFLLPEVVLNDDGLLLDGMDLPAVQDAAGTCLHVVSCNASEYFEEVIQILGMR